MDEPTQPEKKRRPPEQARWWLLGLGALFVILLVFSTQLPFAARDEPTTWTELREMVREHKIEQVVFDGDWVRVKPKAEGEAEKAREILVVRVPGDERFLQLLEDNGVSYRAAQPNPCAQAGPSLLILPLMALGLVWLMLRTPGGPARGMAAFGRSSAQMAPEEGTGVTFADVAGVEGAAEELQEVVTFLRTPEKFTALGGRPPKGVLLVGPPGTGKTLLARAVAGEAGVPFFSISGSAFVEMFVGVGAARVRDLFKNAVDNAPCIIFIDELDAVGKARGVAGPAGNEEREQTLNQLLVEMDGFDNRKGIIVMAATNRPEILDSALLRPGRFDRQVVVDRPDVRGREKILEVHARELKLHDDVDLGEIAKLTPGFAGADLANALNEAALLAARRERDSIRRVDIVDAIERVVAGLEKKNRRLSEREQRVVAYHECGHAICAAASPGADPVTKISIIPRGIAALGYTVQTPLEDRYLMAKSELLNRITVMYGGRAAEEIVFGDVTTGARNDIQKATDMARRMVTEYGMAPAIGAVDYSTDPSSPFMAGGGAGASFAMDASPETAEAIEREVHALLVQCHERARQILLDNRELLEEMSQILLKDEVLDGQQMEDLLARTRPAGVLADPPQGEVVPIRAE